MANKWQKLGVMLKGEKSDYIILGNTKSTNPKYNFTVEYRVKDSEGNVVYKGENGLLSLFKPKEAREGSKVMSDVMVKIQSEE